MKSQPRYQPGDKIGGRYQVHQALMGGMGEVYLCLDLEEMYPYALKTFQQRYLAKAQKLRAAFEQEVATWVALEKHPNIVRCFYMQILDNQPFMVLEWIAGEEGKGTDLRGWLRHGPLDLRLALDFTIDICRGLLHAQEKQPGLVHRDLKPENILIAQGGQAKITDFGLAQIIQETDLELDAATTGGKTDGRQSIVGHKGIAGTPAYMAPEQWHGESLDERTDIYALGCILYEMLTGQGPFQVDLVPTTPQQFQQWVSAMQAGHESGRLPALPANPPATTGDLLQSCLAKARADRPASLTDLLARFTQLYRQQFDQVPPSRPESGDFTAVDYNSRGITYRLLQQHDQALADYNRAIKLDPNNALFFSNRGNAYRELRQYEAALVDHNLAIQLDPTVAGFCTNRGITYTDLQRYDAALADHSRAIELDPNFAPAYNNRGSTYAKLQQYDRALVDFERAIQLDPTLAPAYFNHGSTCRELQRYDEALADYNRAIELDPDYAKAYFKRGNTCRDLQRYDEALDDYNRAIQLDPNDAQVYTNRGNTCRDLQRYDEALADYNRAIQLDPTLALAHLNRGSTYAKLQQYDRALADFGRAIQLDPILAPAYLEHGNTCRDLQRYDEALDDYNRAIQLDPTNAKAYTNRGGTYVNLQRYEEALTDYSQAIQLDPDYAKAYFNIGVVFSVQGNWREAFSYFEKAAQLGFQQGAQYAAQVRQKLGIESAPNFLLAQFALEAFQDAGSVDEMKCAVMEFPFMTNADFITSVEQVISQQVRPSAFEQRLSWLRQIADEQKREE